MISYRTVVRAYRSDAKIVVLRGDRSASGGRAGEEKTKRIAAKGKKFLVLTHKT